MKRSGIKKPRRLGQGFSDKSCNMAKYSLICSLHASCFYAASPTFKQCSTNSRSTAS